MFTNTFEPHVGGVTRSILTLRGELTKRGHDVLVVAPSYEGHRHDEEGVLRIPAIKQVRGTDYSMPIPMSRHIRDEIDIFQPDIIHAHHPFLLGDTGLRMAASLGIPAIYTYHTRYEFYVRHSPRLDGALARLVQSLADGFADIADAVIAPSESIRALLMSRGVEAPIHVIPTGIDLERMGSGSRAAMRARLGLSGEDFVVGHLGRLAAEKNLDYLASSIAAFLRREPKAHFILSGHGPMRPRLMERLAEENLARRTHVLDNLSGEDIASFYAAMDVFAFASLSETQGLVLTEAMAAGTPVVALDAPGAREALGAPGGGLLLDEAASPEAYAAALASFSQLSPAELAGGRQAAQAAAAGFSLDAMGHAVEALYRDLIRAGPRETTGARRTWTALWHAVSTELELLENLFHAAGVAAWPGQGGAAP